jgi:hypothetical protein
LFTVLSLKGHNCSIIGCVQDVLHLHGLNDGDTIAFGNDITYRDKDLRHAPCDWRHDTAITIGVFMA